MRTFIAIELTDEIKNELARIQARLKYAGGDVKWVEKDNIHLTLKFLGEVQEERIDDVVSKLEAVAKVSKPFEMTIKDTGAFPNIDYPRVIWAGLDKGAGESKEIAQKIDEGLEQLGFQKETRAFSPHLTIGRVRSSKNKLELKEKVLSAKIEKPLAQRVDSVILFKSELTSNGPIYTRLHASGLSR